VFFLCVSLLERIEQEEQLIVVNLSIDRCLFLVLNPLE